MPLIISVKAMPSSGKTGCILDKSGSLKCYLKSPAEQGKANNELVKFIAKIVGVTQHQVEIVSGLTSRNKRLKIDADLTLPKLLFLLGIEKQTSFF